MEISQDGTVLLKVTEADIDESGLFSIPDGVATISSNAFRGCSNLRNITLPDSVTSIGNGAFAYCSELFVITIPASVTSIDNHAFEVCYSLLYILCEDNDYTRVSGLLPQDLQSRLFCQSYVNARENALYRLRALPLFSAFRGHKKLNADVIGHHLSEEWRGEALTKNYYAIEARVRILSLPPGNYSDQNLQAYKAEVDSLVNWTLTLAKKRACIRALEQYTELAKENIPEKYRSGQFFPSLCEHNKQIIKRLQAVEEVITRLLEPGKLNLTQEEFSLFDGKVLDFLNKYQVPYEVMQSPEP